MSFYFVKGVGGLVASDSEVNSAALSVLIATESYAQSAVDSAVLTMYSASIVDSKVDSEASNRSIATSTSDSKSLSNSINISVADSKAISDSVLISSADSRITSQGTTLSTADSVNLSTSDSKATSLATLDSTSLSTSDSKATSNSVNISVADSKGVSNSIIVSTADSKTVSNSINISVADSKGTSAATLDSVSLSTSDSKTASNSINVSVADSKAVSVSVGANTKSVSLKVFADSTAISTGDGKMYWTIPSDFAGMNLIEAHAHVYTVSTAGTPTIQIHNATDAQDMLTTRITIDANENDSLTAAAAPVIDATHDDVASGDVIRIDVDVAGTSTKGLEVRLVFRTP